jgi:4'-phosphopantetheinyl transferase EntD
LQIKELNILKDSKTEFIVLAQTEHTSSHRSSSKGIAEHLLEQCRGISSSVSYTEKGKPYLDNRSEFISISHTHQWFCLMLSASHECGIDIEHHRDALHRIAPRFLNSSEMAFVSDCNNPQSVLQFIWGAKEAVYKSWGLRGLEFAADMIVRPFEPKDSCTFITMDFSFRQHQRVYQLSAQQIDDLFLVYTDGFETLMPLI